MNALRVLVVDDEDAMRNALVRLFVARGFEATSASSGKEALQYAQPGRFDLVVLDLWMPEMNGLETLTRFRRLDSSTPVIAVSAMGTDATAAACHAAGATGFLPKPFTAAAIEELAREAKAGRADQEGIASGATRGWRGRILVADDHEAYRQAVARRLRLDGFDVDEVSTGAEVAIVSEGVAYDALLLDIHMPCGDGLFAAEAVRARDPFLPILFMTGEATENEMRQGLASSSAGCLRKPVEIDRLGQFLEFLIATGRQSRKHVEARAAYVALPETRKAVIAVGSKMRRIRRDPETSQIIIGIVVSVIIALGFMSSFDAGQRSLMRFEKSFDATPGPIRMYQTIAGYLERDEQRELEQGKR